MIRRYITLLVCGLLAAAAAYASNDPRVLSTDWRPVSPDELSMKEPKVEKDADAEAIFWETKLDDRKSSRLTISHYVRLKIFTERGREKFSKVDIPFTKGKKVEDVAARVIRPDGSIVELNPSDIFEQEVAKVGKARFMAKSFAVPGIEPGVIVEYQYTETIKDDSVAGERLTFQRDIPMQRVSYWVRPFGKATLRYSWYNLPDARFRDDPTQKGYQVATMYDVPAYKEEPYMPPDDEVRKWAYVTYNTWGNLLVWNRVSFAWNTIEKSVTKPNKDIRQKATELTAGIATDEEKLKRLYDFCQKEIRNISYDRNLNEEQRDRIKLKDAGDVLKQRMGPTLFVNFLFASLAKSLNYEVVLVMSGDRSESFFNPEKYPFISFIEPAGVAVRMGNQWKYLNPGIPYLGFGQTPWYRENVRAMLIGDGGYLWQTPPVSQPESSPAKRTGRFKLSDDGTLEGTATIEYNGHQAIARRRDEYRDSDQKREENFKEEIRSRISTAEITNLSILNFEDSSQPLIYRFNLRVPNYAQRAGRRLLFEPGVFEHGSKPVFSSETRVYNIHFPYPWSVTDDIRIELPKDFELESADSPGEMADPEKIGSLVVAMTIDKASNTLGYKRNFHFGGGGHTLFPSAAYPAIKQLFDAFNKANTHQLSLKPRQD